VPTGARAALVLAATLWGCGSLENPDVARGSVQGRITGAVAGAHAYVLGHPEVATPIAGDGTFQLDGVPAGEQYLVLYDGDLGAELFEVEVEGADLAEVAIDRPLALAGSILAGGNPLGGVRSTGLVFGVDGTPLQGLQAAPTATLFPLPSGKFSLRARQPGFKETVALVRVVSGQSVPVEMHLDVDDDSDARGCLSSTCEEGLACNPADGHCYPCVTSADCPAGGTCTPDHACSPGTAGSGLFCDACTSGADCSGGSCATTNEHGDTTPAYCTSACTPSCPAGTKCVSGTCQVELSCLAYATTFGATCLKSDACAAGIEGGTCYRPPGVPTTSLGTCTASCQGGAACPTGLACDTAAGVCRRPCALGCPQGLVCGADGYCG
jgi:hypothetical protein